MKVICGNCSEEVDTKEAAWAKRHAVACVRRGNAWFQCGGCEGTLKRGQEAAGCPRCLNVGLAQQLDALAKALQLPGLHAGAAGPLVLVPVLMRLAAVAAAGQERMEALEAAAEERKRYETEVRDWMMAVGGRVQQLERGWWERLKLKLRGRG